MMTAYSFPAAGDARQQRNTGQSLFVNCAARHSLHLARDETTGIDETPANDVDGIWKLIGGSCIHQSKASADRLGKSAIERADGAR
jgi:hypothetical protein